LKDEALALARPSLCSASAATWLYHVVVVVAVGVGVVDLLSGL